MEITEHLPIKNIKKLKQYNIRIALDDTGCGFFDWPSIKEFKPSIVKLCITVINQLEGSKNIQNNIQDAINNVKNIDYEIKILVEGVENENQFNILKSMKYIDFAQGYYFEKPFSAKTNYEKIKI